MLKIHCNSYKYHRLLHVLIKLICLVNLQYIQRKVRKSARDEVATVHEEATNTRAHTHTHTPNFSVFDSNCNVSDLLVTFGMNLALFASN